MLRAIDQWLIPYLLRARRPDHKRLHVVIAVCDHFEPFHETDLSGALRTVRHWQERWPDLSRTFRDCRGVHPKHTFFYPIEQYNREVLAGLSALCRESGSEIEVHLHHEHDTAAGLEQKLRDGLELLRSHGCLPSDPDGMLRYGFIHGNWALDDSDPDGRNCGVSDEIGVLRRTGCYADFTMPSAPHGTQTRTINSIYYAVDSPARKSHDRGVPVTTGKNLTFRGREDVLLMVQGPLGLNWRRRKWGLLPKIENAELSRANPATEGRFDLWARMSPLILEGPPWIFVKLHAHGGIERNYASLLGEPMKEFYRAMARRLQTNPEVQIHFATAREMVNMIHAAEDGRQGCPGEFRDYFLKPPPGAPKSPEVI